jgi:hypothetical protein
VYWRKGDEKRILFTAGSYLYAIDAKSGKIIQSFGIKGKVDLREGLGRPAEKQFVISNTPGIIYGDLLILGDRVSEGPGPSAPGIFEPITSKLATSSGPSIPFLIQAKLGMKRGHRMPGNIAAEPMFGVGFHSTKNVELSIAQPDRLLSIFGAGIASGKTYTLIACWPSMQKRGSASGTTNLCITIFGIVTCLRHPTL